MSKSLKDFQVEINCEGWFVKGAPTYYAGQKFSGKKITKRMYNAVLSGETFKNRKDRTVAPTLSLFGGTVSEFKDAYKAAKNAKPVKEAKVAKEDKREDKKDAPKKVKS